MYNDKDIKIFKTPFEYVDFLQEKHLLSPGDINFYSNCIDNETTPEEVIKCLSYGEVEDLQEIDKRLRKAELLLSNSDVDRVSINNSVVGFSPNVARYCQGLPNSMRLRKVEPKKQKIVNVLFDIGVNCNIKNDIYKSSMMQKLEFVLMLERKGYRVRIWSLLISRFWRDKELLLGNLICLKDARQPVNVSKLSFYLTSPKYFRTVGFNYVRRVKSINYPKYGVEDREAHGLGTALYSDENVKALALELITNKIYANNEKVLYVNFRTDINKLIKELN